MVICIAITTNSIVSSIWGNVRAVSGSLKFNGNLASLRSVPDVAALLLSWAVIVGVAIVTEGAVVRDLGTGPVLIAYKIGTIKFNFTPNGTIIEISREMKIIEYCVLKTLTTSHGVL